MARKKKNGDQPIGVGYKKEEKRLNEKAFEEIRVDKNINKIDKNDIRI